MQKTLAAAQPRAFTLIELLIVIAIIGLLGTVVVASVNAAREKGRDAALRQDFNSLVAQASIFYEQNGNSYGTATGACDADMYADTTFVNGLTAIRAANSNGTTTCYAADSTYGFAAARPTSALFAPDSAYWCADSAGGKCGIDDLSSLETTGLCGCDS